MNDHPIWRDFKHVDIDVDTALIFPHGAGGHFLAGYKNQEIFKGKLNEYHLSYANNYTLPWFRLDTWGIEYISISTRLDDMYDVAETIVSPNIKHYNNLILGHYIPRLTSKIFNLSINELVIINVDKEWAWLPMSLANIKNLFASSYTDKHFLIGHILSYFDTLSKVPNSKFASMPMYSTMTADSLMVAATRTKPLRGKLIDVNCPYMWDYVSWIKSNGMQINEETFIEFTSVVFGKSAAIEYYDSYYNDSNIQALEYFQTNTSIIHVDYIDLFFKGRVQNVGSLKVNIKELKQYSTDNIKILKHLLLISNGELLKLLQEKIPQLESFIKEVTHD